MRVFSDWMSVTHIAVLTLLGVFLGTTAVVMVVMAGLVLHAGGGWRLWFPGLSALYAVGIVAILVRAGLGADLPDDAPEPAPDTYTWGLAGFAVMVSQVGVSVWGRPTLDGIQDRVMASVPRSREDLVEGISDQRTIIYGAAIAIFFTHLGVLQNFSLSHLGEDAVYVILDPFRVILQDGLVQGLASPDFQINTYTGNPLFLLPFMLLLGFTPGGLLLLVFITFAASSALTFLSLRKLMDTELALMAVLVLFTMADWLIWSYVPDYIYTVFFGSVLFYLYVCWREEGFDPSSTYLYLLAVTGGMFLMAKATTAYILLALAAGTIYSGGLNMLRDVLTDRNIVPVILVFLLTTAPVLAWAGSHPDQLHWDLFQEVGSATEQRTLGESVQTRLHHIDIYLTPDSDPIMTVLERTGVDEVIGVRLGSANHEIAVPTMLFLLAAGVLLFTRRHVHLLVIMGVLFLLLTIVPGEMDHEHMLVALPLVAGILVGALDALPDRLRSLRLGILIVLATGLLVSLLSPAYSPRGGNQVSEMPYWGGSQPVYDDMTRLHIDEPVVTNAFRVHITARYLLSVPEAHFLIPAGMTSQQADALPEGSGGETSSTERFRSSVDQFLEERDLRRPVTLVLHEELPCVPREEFCGARNEAILELFEATTDDLSPVVIEGQRYLIARGAVPANRAPVWPAP